MALPLCETHGPCIPETELLCVQTEKIKKVKARHTVHLGSMHFLACTLKNVSH